MVGAFSRRLENTTSAHCAIAISCLAKSASLSSAEAGELDVSVEAWSCRTQISERPSRRPYPPAPADQHQAGLGEHAGAPGEGIRSRPSGQLMRGHESAGKNRRRARWV